MGRYLDQKILAILRRIEEQQLRWRDKTECGDNKEQTSFYFIEWNDQEDGRVFHLDWNTDTCYWTNSLTLTREQDSRRLLERVLHLERPDWI